MGAQCTALLLIAAIFVFLAGAGFWLIKEFEQSLEMRLRAVSRRPRRWRWIHNWMIAGTIISAAANVSLAALLDNDAWFLARLAATAFLVGCSAMLGSLLFGLIATPPAAAATAGSGTIPPGYEARAQRANRLYEVHMMLSYASWAVVGAAILQGSLLPHWLGWIGVGLGAVSTVGFATVRGPFAPPILAHFFGLVVGTVLLGA